jgi:hypothetical protein
LRSPIIKYYNGDSIYIYRITYSPYPIEDLVGTADPAILDQIQSKEVTLRNGDDRVTLDLGTADGLDATTNYYAMINPIDIYDDIGTSSDQICFNLSQEKYDIGDNCMFFGAEPTPATGDTASVLDGEVDGTPVPTEEHSASSTTPDLALANITHTVTGNVITLKWTAIDGIDSMDILVFDPSDEAWHRVDEVKMSDERYDYTMKRDGEHIFNFKPLNGGKEIRYELNAMRGEEKEPTPPKPIPPVVVGPAENVAALILLSLGAYVGYRLYRKRYS